MTDIISLFRRASMPDTAHEVSLIAVLNGIRSGRWADDVAAIRGADTKVERRSLKLSLLAAATFSGTFERRSNDALIQHSGLICLDFDDVTNPVALRDELARHPNICASFLSVSGAGVKALVPVEVVDPETGECRPPRDDHEHKEAWTTVAALFPAASLDTACKDVSRLCYVSHDPDLKLNDAVVSAVCELRSDGDGTAKAPRHTKPATRGGDVPLSLDEIGELLSYLSRLPTVEDYALWLSTYANLIAFCEEHGHTPGDARSLLEQYFPARERTDYPDNNRGLNRGHAGAFVNLLKDAGLDYSGWLRERYCRLRGDSAHTSARVSASAGADEWPEPQPVRHTSDRFPVPPAEAEWLPERIMPWVTDVAYRMQIALDFPAVAAMVMLSACIGRRVAIRPKRRDGWTVVCNLWGLIVGRPGLMKSPVLKQIAAPLVRLHVEAQKAYELALQTHEAALLAFEAQKAAVKEQMKKALKKNPHADVSDLASELVPPEPPKREEYVVWDASPEALIETARDNPNGFLQLRDEGSGLIARLQAPNAGEERAIYLSSWNGDEPTAQKRIGRGYVAAEAVCQSFLGGIQPGKLTELIGDALHGGMGDDGMAQRFQLLVQPDLPTDFELVDEWPDDKARRSVYELVQALVHMNATTVGAEQDTGFEGEPEGVPYLRFGTDAQAVFNEWLTVLERRLRSGSLHPALESHLAKYRSLIPSLALILHLADGARGPVSSAALDRALAWGDYLEAHALRVYGMAQTPGEAGARQLARKVLAGELGDRFTVRTLYRKGWGGLASREEAQAAVDLLVDLGWFREKTATNGKRSFTEYVVNPRIADADRRTLLPRREAPLTHRRMVTPGPEPAHASAYVSASVPPSFSKEELGDGAEQPAPVLTWENDEDLGKALEGKQ